MQRHLVVFVKAPRRGQVKTRLAGTLGAGGATQFYRQQAGALLRRLGADRRWQLWLAVTPDRFAGAPFWPGRFRRLTQGGGDLGQRMVQSFAQLPPGPAVLVGSDIPGIERRHIAEAFHRLGTAEAVFGPALDGGYWLIGLQRRRPLPGLFAAVRWSGQFALGDTLANLLGRRVGFVASLSDIDTAEDYRHWRQRAAG